MSWRRLQDVLKTSSRSLEDVFAKRLSIMSSRRLQDSFKTCLQSVLQLCLQDVFKTPSRHLGRQKNVTLKTSWKRLQDVFSTSSPRRMFARNYGILSTIFLVIYSNNKVIGVDYQGPYSIVLFLSGKPSIICSFKTVISQEISITGKFGH